MTRRLLFIGSTNREENQPAHLTLKDAPVPVALNLALQIDIGFGDAVTPAAQPVTYPTLLPDVPAPTLRAYPKATVADAVIHRSLACADAQAG